MFDPTELATLTSVARTRSFASTATALGIAASTVSLHISKLERDAGVPLVERRRGRVAAVTLTTEGTLLVRLAADVAESRERLARQFTPSTERGRVRFALADDLASSRLADAVRGFRQLHPGVEVELTIGQSAPLLRRFRAGQFDLVLAKRYPGGTEGRVLQRDRYVWAAHPEQRIDSTEPLPLVLYPAASVSRLAAIRALAAIERPWRLTNTVRGVNGAVTAIRAGLGVGILAERLLPADLVDVGAALGLPPIGEFDYVLLDNPDSAQGALPALIERLMIASRRLTSNVA